MDECCPHFRAETPQGGQQPLMVQLKVKLITPTDSPAQLYCMVLSLGLRHFSDFPLVKIAAQKRKGAAWWDF